MTMTTHDNAAPPEDWVQVRHHCGDITTDITCAHCGVWLVPVPADA